MCVNVKDVKGAMMWKMPDNVKRSQISENMRSFKKMCDSVIKWLMWKINYNVQFYCSIVCKRSDDVKNGR